LTRPVAVSVAAGAACHAAASTVEWCANRRPVISTSVAMCAYRHFFPNAKMDPMGLMGMALQRHHSARQSAKRLRA